MAPTAADESSHSYQVGDTLTLWVNKVGPYNNPQETYNYYLLPFCKPKDEKPRHKWGGLGEVLQGNELIDSQLEVKYRTDIPKRSICSVTLTEDDSEDFAEAIKRHYWYELFMDDLPIWGFVGPPPEQTNDDTNVYLYTHKSLDIAYNGDRIIHINLTSENPQPISPGAAMEFTYSITWEATSVPYSRRFERYLDYNFFEHQIHWFSIFNSFMMVIFLVGLVAMILLRTLRRDYARYTRHDDDDDDLERLERDMGEETGWKLVHGDVFRPPMYLELFSALLGTGVQLALLVLTVIVVTIAGTLFVERGTIVTVFIVAYALTSFVGGYYSGGYYSRNGGTGWIQVMVLTASLFPVTVFSISFVLNTIAIFYQSLAAVPFGSIVVVLLIWMFISFPLCLFGTVVGRNWAGASDNPCRIKRIPSPIPDKKWYLTPPIISLLGGLLPFGSIFIEMYFVFTSFWNYKVYYVYGFFLLVFLILHIVTICVTIVGTYFLLNAENYHWHWTAFGSGASTALYVYLYAIHYFIAKTRMTGFFQTAFYFGYTAMFCIGLGLMCGAVGYMGARAFVKRIYRNIKCD